MNKYISHLFSFLLLATSAVIISYSLSYPPPVAAACINGARQCCNSYTGYQICWEGVWGDCIGCSYGCYAGSCKSAPAPTATPQPVCNPDSWRCCTVTTVSDGHQQCRSDGSGWGSCSQCSYKCDISRPQYCLSAPTPTPIPPTPTPTKICTPYEWQCCNLNTGHQQCGSTGTYWSNCYICGYNCNLVTGACIIPTPTPTPRPTSTPVPFCQTGTTQCCDLGRGSQYCVNNSYWSTCITCTSGCNVLTGVCIVPTPTPTPGPTATPIPFCQTGTTQCCDLGRGSQYCVNNSRWSTCRTCSYGCNPLTDACYSSPPPTFTPVPPTPDLQCDYEERACCNSTQLKICVNGQWSTCESCSSGFTCSYGRCVPPCEPNSSVCTDPEPDSSLGPKLVTCDSTGLQTTISYCPVNQICNLSKTDCVYPVTEFNSDECKDGSTICEDGIKWYCLYGSWEPIASTTGTGCPQPTPVPPTPTPYTYGYYNCPIGSSGYSNCSQVNPLWTNAPLIPSCWEDKNGDGELQSDEIVENTFDPNTGTYKLTFGNSGCGPASVCSLLCECKQNSTFCNLTSCIKEITKYNVFSCSGTGVDLNVLALDQFPECYSASQIIPSSNIWTDVDKYLESDKIVLVQGQFTLKSDPNKIYSHNTLIVKKDSRGYVFNDSFFNTYNSDPVLRITHPYLLEVFNFNLQYAGIATSI